MNRRLLPLAGTRVLELASAAAAPFSTYWLATLGAEVIKVESYEHTDVARRLEPYADGIPGVNRSGMFNTKGINKWSCTVNLSTESGRSLVHRLIGLSDIVIENFSYSVWSRFNMTYPMMSAIRPDIILVSCSALGRTGPARSAPGYNENVSSFSGLASLTGYTGGPPGLPGSTWADYLSGASLAFATMTAYFHRIRTGRGQHVDLAMAEAAAVQIPEAILDYTMNQEVRGRQGNDDEFFVPNGMFPCLGIDQWVALTVATDEQWHSLVALIGSPAWASDPAFASRDGRIATRDFVHRNLAAWTATRELPDVIAAFRDCGLAAGPVLDSPSRLADPHLQDRHFYQLIDHPETGPRHAAGLPFQFSSHPDIEYRSPPLLGQDNEYVFNEVLGMSDEEFAGHVGDHTIY